jgi:hypothetical protein
MGSVAGLNLLSEMVHGIEKSDAFVAIQAGTIACDTITDQRLDSAEPCAQDVSKHSDQITRIDTPMMEAVSPSTASGLSDSYDLDDGTFSVFSAAATAMSDKASRIRGFD